MTAKRTEPVTEIVVRLTPDEKKEIEHAANFEERSTSGWCRLVLLKMARVINRLPPEAE